jgi:NAD+ synthase/NAD+ synthase (glutamine-hydrolysing)
MKIALVQFNPVVGDFAGNAARIAALAREAAGRGANLAVFSEMCVCGYPPQDLIERPAFLRRNVETVERLAGEIALPVIVGYVGPSQESTGKSVANCAALLMPEKAAAKGRIAFVQRKMLLPTYDVFDESRYFQPAHSQTAIDFSGARLGLTVCEDIWNDKSYWKKPLYLRDPVQELMGQGMELLINISASPYELDKRNLRLEMVRALARRHRRPVVYVNQVGGNDSLIFDGSSLAVAPDGRIAAQARSFEEDLVLFDTSDFSGDLRAQPVDELETAYRALVCGTRDYVRKCGFQSVTLGLSGGIDSAVVACLAAEAVGPENVLGVAMPGPFSSPESLRDAQTLARNLGMRCLTLPISEAYEKYLLALAPAFEGRPRDVTEENIQARIRGNFLMALSNKLGALVLTTGNKSELAVGYCTLYGDMAGGLAPISDVPKTMVYALADFINREREVIPRESLRKPPSAELRPNQTDQDTLPPYDVLDRIIKGYVERLESPEEIAQRYGFDTEMVRRLAAQIDRNEYKRKQAAPGLKITSKAFCIGRPFPVAQKFES